VISAVAKESWDQIYKTYAIPPEAKAVALEGDENRLFHISTTHRAPQVLRLSPPGTDRKWITSELMVLQHISQTTKLRVPVPIPDKHGRLCATIHEPGSSGPTQIVLSTFVDGRGLSNIQPTSDLMFRIGRTLGELDLALKCADKVLRPSPSKIRGRRDGGQIIDWALQPFRQKSVDWSFLKKKRGGNRLHPEIEEMAERLRVNYGKLNAFLPKQLLHFDAHMENLVLDGNTIGILDFNNLACGPRIYELAAPLHAVYETNASQDTGSRSSGPADLIEALIAGYGSRIRLSRMEVKGFSLIQALRLFSGLGWAVGRQYLSPWKNWLEQYGAATAGQISALLDEFESSVAFSNLQALRGWIDRAVQIRRPFQPSNTKNSLH